ncbi:putative methyltransferase DDB_G0268948 [Styela clava]
MIRVFEKAKHAELYAVYRPKYPNAVVEDIAKYVKMEKGIVRGDKIDLMVDVGCGTGHSTNIFQPYVRKIIGFDPSKRQIEQAMKRKFHTNISYMVSQAEAMPLRSDSVDLVCSGMSAHWLDFELFYRECRRVLKPTGCLALYGYCRPALAQIGSDPDPRVTPILSELHSKCVWHERNSHVHDRYCKIFDKISTENKHRIDSHKIQQSICLEDFLQYVSTWSGYQKLLDQKSLPELDILTDFANNLKKLWGMEQLSDNQVNIQVTWEVFVILAGRL